MNLKIMFNLWVQCFIVCTVYLCPAHEKLEPVPQSAVCGSIVLASLGMLENKFLGPTYFGDELRNLFLTSSLRLWWPVITEKHHFSSMIPKHYCASEAKCISGYLLKCRFLSIYPRDSCSLNPGCSPGTCILTSAPNDSDPCRRAPCFEKHCMQVCL